MNPRIVRTIEDAKALIGQEIGVTDWVLVDQQRIDRFAEATDDHQWIHVDTARARSEMPGGQTIAHGYLVLSLLPALMDKLVTMPTLQRAINYGLNKVRFKNPVPAGSRVRLRSVLLQAQKRAGALQVILENTIEIEGQAKPACVAEVIALYFLDGS
ncbi:MAG: MaoC family dehydratase [Gammaproteobacteria bacterium]|nr:MAG: MaoC family dehydratase [Pseudomonadota bacterium]MBC6944300.1 MaoC family dehydratase [Gammaproteobacteria bacterium]MCE7896228.1 MaoC family dehydratase [Gammaproteobacteria bacterium PRO8]MDL1879443.1 MaoC family dehydratase [Gammaproteobacteria bacterium PRO2]MCL4777633.1 MaoC family dehydratase [Gammaproteobacteria bacterium]